jgi:predicted permease
VFAWLRSLLLKFGALQSRTELDRDLDDEFAFHLQMKSDKLRAEGVTADQAPYSASRRLGNATRLKEEVRDQWTFAVAEGIWQDIRHAVRALRRAPGFACVAVLSLALAVGANTSIFTVLNALFLRSLPVEDPARLRIVTWTGKDRMPARSRSGYSMDVGGVRVQSSFSWDAYQRIEGMHEVFSSAAGFTTFNPNVVVRSQAQVARGMLVTGRFFETLGVPAALGRTLTSSDDAPGAPHIAVIAWALYQRAFGGDASALGSTITLDRTPYTVAGVLPRAFTGMEQNSPVEVYVPMARVPELAERHSFVKRDSWWVQMIARLAPGVTDAQARAAVDVALARATQVVAEERGEKLNNPKCVLLEGRTGLAFLNQRIRDFLLTLLAMVGLVLLIACANIANLLLARGAARQRELAVRQSIGAGRFRLARHLLTETMVIAAAGGVLGFALAQVGTAVLSSLILPPSETAVRIEPDVSVLGFTLALTFITALLFGVGPALRGTDVAPAACLRQSGAGSGTLRQRVAWTLVVVQVSAAVVLVAGTGLFARTMLNLRRVEIGFRPENILLFNVDARRNGYRDTRLIDAYRRIQEKVASIPGVHAVTLSRHAVLSGSMSNSLITIPGYQPRPGEELGTHVHVVGSRFLTVMGTPVLLGRDIQSSDDENAPKIAVINATLAKRWFEGNPIGRELVWNAVKRRIVGVSGDVKYDAIRDSAPPTIYVPYAQELRILGSMTFEVRTSVEPLSLAAAIRRSVADIDPTLPIAQVRTQEQQINQLLSRERSFAILATFFSSVAVLLACIGIYGVLAYAVTRRTSEFGIRLALGATAAGLRWLVMRGTLGLIAVSLAIGVPAALAAAKLVRAMLFGIEPADPLTMTGAGAAIVAAALLAAWIPSQRAAKCDPALALRCE